MSGIFNKLITNYESLKIRNMPGNVKYKYSIIAVFIYTLLSTSANSQNKTVRFKTFDKVIVTANLYTPNPVNSPFIILYHQANYSRGEYLEIAPKLNSMGFNCIAVDLRSGEAVNGVVNQTWKFADSLNMETRYIDAYTDMRAAVSYVKNKYPGTKIFLFGSSYSSSLALKLAGDFPNGISGVVAFSPGEYFSKFGWSRDIIQTSSSKIKCPVFITSSLTERDNWQEIYNAIPVQSKTCFLPETGGKHGAKTLWSAFPESDQYWKALKAFLLKYK
ncbi:MAG: alpha/beta hydrolase [Bacteroidales bacterium]|nr:alpha/beta hydrolase [Bacteroidales bacterium]